jgi:hypothetical protein
VLPGMDGNYTYFRGGLQTYQNYLTEVVKKVLGTEMYSDDWYSRKWFVCHKWPVRT